MKSILVVDDELDIRVMMKKILEVEGYKVETAASGNEAFEKFTSGDFSVVLSDIRMDDGDGIELLEQLRNIDQNASLICLITGYTNYSTNDLLAKGANNVLRKPINYDLILEIIKDFLSKSS